MKVVGLTGGIGSGKSTVAKMFHELGVAVYIADDEAKKLMQKDSVLIREIQQLLGEEAYKNTKLNRPYIATKVFQDKLLLEKLNAIVHPAVGKDFTAWKNKQRGVYVVKEAAILFENDGYTLCNKTILVIASVKTRIKRVMQRDKSTIEEIQTRIANQWTDEKKIKLADFVIDNEESISKTKLQVAEMHQKLLKIFHYKN